MHGSCSSVCITTFPLVFLEVWVVKPLLLAWFTFIISTNSKIPLRSCQVGSTHQRTNRPMHPHIFRTATGEQDSFSLIAHRSRSRLPLAYVIPHSLLSQKSGTKPRSRHPQNRKAASSRQWLTTYLTSVLWENSEWVVSQRFHTSRTSISSLLPASFLQQSFTVLVAAMAKVSDQFLRRLAFVKLLLPLNCFKLRLSNIATIQVSRCTGAAHVCFLCVCHSVFVLSCLESNI